MRKEREERTNAKREREREREKEREGERRPELRKASGRPVCAVVNAGAVEKSRIRRD